MHCDCGEQRFKGPWTSRQACELAAGPEYAEEYDDQATPTGMTPESETADDGSGFWHRGDAIDEALNIGNLGYFATSDLRDFLQDLDSRRLTNYFLFSTLHGDGRFQSAGGFRAGRDQLVLATLGWSKCPSEQSPRIVAGRRQSDRIGFAGW